MSVLDLCRNARSQWIAFSRLVWPEDSGQLTQATIDLLADELAGRYARLLARRRRIESVRDRLSRQARRFPGDVSLTHLRERLATLEDAYARRRLAFARRKKLHKALLSGQIVACPPPTDADPT